MVHKKTARQTKSSSKSLRQASQLTEYAQAVIMILKRLGVLTLVLTIPTTAILLTQQDLQQAQIYLADSERTATLTVDPERSTVISGEWFKVKVHLDTGGSQITEAKAVLRYDQGLIKIEEIRLASFAQNNNVEIDNDNGRAVVRSFFNADSPGYFSGQGTWFEAVISTDGEGLADFWFDCRRDAEDETNLMRFGGGDIVNCNNIGQGWFTVNLVNQSVVSSEYQSGVCNNIAPGTPQNFSIASGPGRGEVTLRWSKVSGATHYTVTYGTASGSYQYGSPDIGDVDYFTVQGLNPGQRYYFVITAVNVCASSGYTNELSATAGYGVITKTTYNYSQESQEKGIQPPIPPEFLPDEETEATESSEATGSALTPTPSPSSTAVTEEEVTTTKPWQRLDFWLLAGGIALGGFILILVGSLLSKGIRKDGELPPHLENNPETGAPTQSDNLSSLPSSPWQESASESQSKPEPEIPESPWSPPETS